MHTVRRISPFGVRYIQCEGRYAITRHGSMFPADCRQKARHLISTPRGTEVVCEGHYQVRRHDGLVEASMPITEDEHRAAHLFPTL